MFSFLNPIKAYLIAGLTAIVAIFIAVFKYRGVKIDNLEKEVTTKDTAIKTTAKVVEAEKKAAKFIADNRVARAVAEGEDAKDIDKYDPNTKFYI